MDQRDDSEMFEARRRFLAKCGKFAAVTPPAMTLLLTSTHQSYAVAGSNNGFGNGGFDGTPGNSGNNPSPQAPSKREDVVR